MVAYDGCGSTTPVYFTAAQATPAIVQYDGTGGERVRIGALGGGAYGARFKDASGNITFEQGDTLKQQYMKIDSLEFVKQRVVFRYPWNATVDNGTSWGATAFNGKHFAGAKGTTLYLGSVGAACEERIALSSKWTAPANITRLWLRDATGSTKIFVVATLSNGAVYFGIWDENYTAYTQALAMTQVVASGVKDAAPGVWDSSANELSIVTITTADHPGYLRASTNTGAVTLAHTSFSSYYYSGIRGIVPGNSKESRFAATFGGSLYAMRISWAGSVVQTYTLEAYSITPLVALCVSFDDATPANSRWVVVRIQTGLTELRIYNESGTLISTAAYKDSLWVMPAFGGTVNRWFAERMPLVSIAYEGNSSSARNCALGHISYLSVMGKNLADSLSTLSV
jgi:hypothetical protein